MTAPDRLHSKHENCVYIDGDFCVDCMKDLDDYHPEYIRGWNACIDAIKESK